MHLHDVPPTSDRGRVAASVSEPAESGLALVLVLEMGLGWAGSRIEMGPVVLRLGLEG